MSYSLFIALQTNVVCLHIWGLWIPQLCFTRVCWHSQLACWHCFETLTPRQNGRHSPDDIFKCIFLNENVWIAIKISLKFVPKGPINNIPALVQIMDWRRPGDRPLFEPMVVKLLTHICITRPQWVNITSWYRGLLLWEDRYTNNMETKARVAHLLTSCKHSLFNSSPPSDIYMCQWIGLVLVQIMACRLFGAKPLSEPMLGYCQLD